MTTSFLNLFFDVDCRHFVNQNISHIIDT